jgi:hypothetical protein
MDILLTQMMGLSDLPASENAEPKRQRVATLEVAPLCPATSGLGFDAIDHLAQNLAMGICGGSDMSPFDVCMQAMEDMGGEVRSSQTPHRLLLVAETKSRFAVTKANPWDLSVALGHMVLHFEPHRLTEEVAPLAIPNHVRLETSFAQARSEASVFATSFLMPQDKMRRLWQAGGLEAAAKALRLSRALVSRRAAQLGLVSL